MRLYLLQLLVPLCSGSLLSLSDSDAEFGAGLVSLNENPESVALDYPCNLLEKPLNSLNLAPTTSKVGRKELTKEEKRQLDAAIVDKDVDALKAILGDGMVNLQFCFGSNMLGRSPLTVVSGYGTVEILQLLRNHGLEIVGEWTYNGIRAAMADRNIPIMKYLMLAYPDVSKFEDGHMIMYYACTNYRGCLLIQDIEWILATFPAARLWLNEPFYQMPLHVARDLDVMRLLLSYGADPNATRWSDGATKLHTVMWEGTTYRAEKIRCLLDGGADAKIKDVHGRTPLDVLMTYSPDEESIQLLSEAQ